MDDYAEPEGDCSLPLRRAPSTSCCGADRIATEQLWSCSRPMYLLDTNEARSTVVSVLMVQSWIGSRMCRRSNSS